MLHKLAYRLIFALCTVAGFAATAAAHEFSTSYSRIQVAGNTVEVLFTVNLRDVQTADVAKAIEANFKLRAPEAPTTVTLRRSETIADDVVLFAFEYTFGNPVARLTVTSTLDRITEPNHSHLVQIGEGEDAREAVITALSPTADIHLREKTFFATIWDFVKLGMEHIFTGYDHLAFLAGLLIMTTTFGSLIKVISSFTAAHSITLALATFRIVTLPSSLNESLIALSIAYIAVENFTGRTLVHRWKITFLFGLVHGFGFSNVLQEMALTRRSLALSLFSFNGGVELGQLMFVAAVFPVVYYVTASRWKSHFRSAMSAVIASLGLFWFIQRAL